SAFANAALTRGERSADPADVARERDALSLDARYWSQLEVRFQHFMSDLGPSDNPDTPLEDWTLDLAALARAVFREATRASGGDSRWLMAQAIGGKTLDYRFRKRVPE